MQMETTRSDELRAKVRDVIREERRVNREIADAVLAGAPVEELRARRRELRDTCEDLTLAAQRWESLEGDW